MKKLFCGLFCFFTSLLISQNNDSLMQLFRNSSLPDTIRLGALQTYCANLVNNNYPDSALKYADKILSLAKESKQPLFEATAYRIMANSYAKKFDSPRSLEYILKALKISEQAGDKKGMA